MSERTITIFRLSSTFFHLAWGKQPRKGDKAFYEPTNQIKLISVRAQLKLELGRFNVTHFSGVSFGEQMIWQTDFGAFERSKKLTWHSSFQSLYI